MAVPISKTDLRNIILQLGNYISLGGKLYFPRWESDSTDRHKPAEQNPDGYSVKTEAGEETIIIRIKL